jgi:hypothetical protein
MAIESGTDPVSPDFMNFNKGSQPVVDTAFLAQAIVRAPTELWIKLDAKTQRNAIDAFESSRQSRPGYDNWLLFSAMVEAALSRMGAWWDPMRVDYASRSVCFRSSIGDMCLSKISICRQIRYIDRMPNSVGSGVKPVLCSAC